MTDDPRTDHGWSDDARKLIAEDAQLRRLGTEGLDALLTDEEKAAMDEHLRLLAEQRRRVEAVSRNEPMP